MHEIACWTSAVHVNNWFSTQQPFILQSHISPNEFPMNTGIKEPERGKTSVLKLNAIFFKTLLQNFFLTH